MILCSATFLSACATDAHGSNAYLAVGGGTMKHKTEGSDLDDKTTASYFALGGELMFTERFGAGLRMEGSASDDDLFSDVVPGGASQVTDGDLFLHGTVGFGEKPSEMPLRVGFFFRGYSLEENASSAEIDWSSFGPRVEFAPEIKLIEREGFRWSLPCRVGVGVGLTVVDTDPATEDWDTSMIQYDIGVSSRLRFSKVFADIGYLLRQSNYNESDVVGGAFIRGMESTFSGLILTVGVKF
jgi:hypothetical protein